MFSISELSECVFPRNHICFRVSTFVGALVLVASRLYLNLSSLANYSVAPKVLLTLH